MLVFTPFMKANENFIIFIFKHSKIISPMLSFTTKY